MIEFQKRGLSHCHILLFLRLEDKIKSVENIDNYIFVELPSELDDAEGFAIVCNQMMHDPCGVLNLSCPSMYNEKCTVGYPKNHYGETFTRRDGWPCYTRPNNARVVSVGYERIKLDNRIVVWYNRDLLVKYGCHIHVEWCNHGMLPKYLFNYINKGTERATADLEGSSFRTTFASLVDVENEIEEYINCRYISSAEACWTLFEFDIRYCDVAVESLPFHEEGCNRVYFHGHECIEDVAEHSMAAISKFTAWMRANEEYNEGHLLTYVEFPTHFTWYEKEKEQRPRENGNTIGSLYYVTPSIGE